MTLISLLFYHLNNIGILFLSKQHVLLCTQKNFSEEEKGSMVQWNWIQLIDFLFLKSPRWNSLRKRGRSEASMVQWNWTQPVEFLFLKSWKVCKKDRVWFSEASETGEAKTNSTEQLSPLANRQNVFRKLTFQILYSDLKLTLIIYINAL